MFNMLNLIRPLGFWKELDDQPFPQSKGERGSDIRMLM